MVPDLIDRHFAIIARCVHTPDVVDAVRFGRSEGLEISVRGGGHNVAARAVTDGGLTIDLSLMKGIHVDPVRSTVRAQAGVTVGELDRATGAQSAHQPRIEVAEQLLLVSDKRRSTATRACAHNRTAACAVSARRRVRSVCGPAKTGSEAASL